MPMLRSPLQALAPPSCSSPLGRLERSTPSARRAELQPAARHARACTWRVHARGKGSQGSEGGAPARAPQSRQQTGDEEVLDLSAFLAGLEDEEDGDGSDGDSDSDEMNTWIYNSDEDKVVKGPARKVAVARVAAPPAKRGKPARKRDDDLFEDDDDSDDDDGDWAGLEADGDVSHIVTASQLVDGRNLEDSIDYLSTIKVEDLDPGSRLLLQEELARKKQVRRLTAPHRRFPSPARPRVRQPCYSGREEQWARGSMRCLPAPEQEQAAKQKRVQDTSTEPPKGQRRTHRQLQVISGSVRRIFTYILILFI